MRLDRHHIGSNVVKRISGLQKELFIQQGPGTTHHLEKWQRPLTYTVWGRPEIATVDDRVAS
jgi:hypothetical protein